MATQLNRNRYIPYQSRPMNPLSYGYGQQNQLPINQAQPSPYDIYKYGQGIQLPTAPSVQSPQPPQDVPPDFVDQYRQLTSKRPNRLAYQQAIEGGPPQIERSKWARLGATLAGGLQGFATGDPASGFNLAQSSYYAPQQRSDINYREKVKGLGSLAEFEESDISNEIKALEMKQSDWYKQRENRRQDEATALAARQETRAEKLTDIQIQNIKSEMDERGTDKWTNPLTGITYKRSKNGTVTQIGQEELTPEQKIKFGAQEVTAKKGAEEPFAISASERARKQAVEVANIGYDKSIDTANIRAKADSDKTAARLRADAAKRKPGDIYGMVQLEMAEAIEQRLLPPEAANYLSQSEGGVPISKYPNMFGSNDELEEKVRQFIGQSITRNKGGGNVPPPTGGGEQAGQEMSKQVRNKQTGETATVYSYDGGKTWSLDRRK